MCIYVVKHEKLLPPPSEREYFDKQVALMQKGKCIEPVQITEKHLQLPLWYATLDMDSIPKEFQTSCYFMKEIV